VWNGERPIVYSALIAVEKAVQGREKRQLFN
jgi:hypothetical protein